LNLSSSQNPIDQLVWLSNVAYDLSKNAKLAAPTYPGATAWVAFRVTYYDEGIAIVSLSTVADRGQTMQVSIHEHTTT